MIIGRNEGERLVRCIKSALPQSEAVVYVDSGSTDGSVERARELGAKVVELDRSVPFSASRARNTGFAALREMRQLDCVQFVDGDCEILEGWIAAGSGVLNENENFAAVCGRLRERNPDASIYNQICDVEWSVKSGESEACGGVAMPCVARYELPAVNRRRSSSATCRSLSIGAPPSPASTPSFISLDASMSRVKTTSRARRSVS